MWHWVHSVKYEVSFFWISRSRIICVLRGFLNATSRSPRVLPFQLQFGPQKELKMMLPGFFGCKRPPWMIIIAPRWSSRRLGAPTPLPKRAADVTYRCKTTHFNDNCQFYLDKTYIWPHHGRWPITFLLFFCIFLGNVRHRVCIVKHISKWMSAISLDGRDIKSRR